MDVREKLVDIVCDPAQINGCIHMCNHPPCAMVSNIVDALIENGVTVQECKLGAKKTNADRIRSMSDEELKKFICSMFKCEFCDFELGERCGLLNWLQMPAEESDNG